MEPRRRRHRRALTLAGAVSALLLGVLTVPVTPAAALRTFTVNTTVDAPDNRPGDGRCRTSAGRCSLRAAVEEAGVANDADRVVVPAGTYPLGSELVGRGNLQIVGAGRDLTAITAPGTVLSVRGDVFTKEGATYELRDLTLRGGRAGGTIGLCTLALYDARALTTRVTITGAATGVCTAPAWTSYLSAFETWIVDNADQGVSRLGVVELTASRVERNNHAPLTPPGPARPGGGGVLASEVVLLDSVVRDNEAFGDGGGIRVAELTLSRSTVADNASGARGGGVAVRAVPDPVLAGEVGRVQVVDSTLAGNFSPVGGSALDLEAAATGARLDHATIAGNRGGGRGAVSLNGPGLLVVDRSIVANASGGDCDAAGGGIVNITRSNLLLRAGTCSIAGGALVGVDPLLGPLTDRLGDLTPTMMPEPTSPVVDVLGPDDLTCNGIDSRDQRHRLRPIDGDGDGRTGCDLGAVERDPSLVSGPFDKPFTQLGIGACPGMGHPFGLCGSIDLLDHIEEYYGVSLPAWMRDCWADGPRCGP